MNPEGLKERTKKFAIEIIKIVKLIEKQRGAAGKNVSSQLFRCGTSVAANYRAACRCKSRKDFISKMGTVVEEADETQFWLEIVESIKLVQISLKTILQEASEITAIMTASRNSAIRNQD
jgi:four helix bundle protein